VSLEVIQRRGHCRIVCVDDLVGGFLGPKGVEERDRFRGPESEIEAWHPGLVMTVADRLADGGITSFEDRGQLSLENPAFQPEVAGPAPSQ
jgi:hypothetical protein